MFKLSKIIRPSILNLNPYSSARSEFKGYAHVFLDANENPFGVYNRYPDPYQTKLKQKLYELKNVLPENIFIGNGSDEVIDIAFLLFCIPFKDSVIICPPTYGMYEIRAKINETSVINIPLLKDFQLNIDEILNTSAKIIFLCSPNNPTGNTLNNIEQIIKYFNGIVFVDEAYIDFSNQPSLINKINQYPNLIVSQTLSKAWGKAAIRIGIAYANEEIIKYYNKIKPPYNVSEVNQLNAIKVLNKAEVVKKRIQIIINQRERLIKQLKKLKLVECVYPTDANFILVKVKDANLIYNQLLSNQIVVRNRHTVIDNCLRITVGTPKENRLLIKTLKKLEYNLYN